MLPSFHDFVWILIGPSQLVRDYFQFETLSNIEMKGKEKPQEAYELIGVGEVDTRFRASVAKGLTPFVSKRVGSPSVPA